MKFPNLFIVGTAKAGTSSLWDLLRQHPSVFLPENELFKEPAYFSDKASLNEKDYFGLFAGAKNKKYVGEASTAYMVDPLSASRIHEFNPQARIIIMLRNPVLRAFSLYNWMVQEGYEYSKSFEDALEKEPARKGKKIPNFFEPEYYHNYMYFSSGLYNDQIMRYVSLFGKNNVFIGLFEEFIQDERAFLKRILNFLGLSMESLNPSVKRKNKSIKVIHPCISFFMRKTTSYFWRVAPLEIKNKKHRDLMLQLTSLRKRPEPINERTYLRLKEAYANEYITIEKNFNLNLSLWREADNKYLAGMKQQPEA